MSELEPDDSRDITLSDTSAPGEPKRTGAREGETRKDDDALQQAKPKNTGQAGYGNGGEAEPKD